VADVTCPGEPGFECVDEIEAKGLCRRCYHRQWKKAHPGYNRRWYAANPGWQKEYDRQRYPARREAMKERVSRWQRDNPERVAEKNRRWQKANLGKVRERGRRYYARKASALTIPYTVEQLAAKMAYWGNRCWMCGGPFEQVDHMIAIALGGPHVLANLRPACQSCNASKGAKPLSELLEV
jgi:5-methylcytosine-specific restriction endonuclease McrA